MLDHMCVLSCCVVLLQRRRLSWRTAEREALKRLLFAHGVGKWKEVSSCDAATGVAHPPWQKQQQQQVPGNH